ncbi:MAG: ATP-binding protein [Lachnospiraceae bacterium]|nr:ATP-binding protein [Lachnospiraceae bacterium]
MAEALREQTGREFVTGAKTENLGAVNVFVEEILDQTACPDAMRMQILICVEEIFVNIASYAYQDGDGDAVVFAQALEDPAGILIRFSDEGIPYDPLAKEDPDITLSAAQRPIGGLGIFMTKKMMDEVSYEYSDNRNVLTLKKYFQRTN